MSDTARSWFLAQSEEPVIPDFGEGSDCVVENRFFCTDWVRENWSGVIQPALLEHVKLMLIAVVIGFAIAFVAAIVTHRYRLTEKPFVVFSAIVYGPQPRALPAPRPRDRPHRGNGRDRLVGYALILYRNILEGLRGVPADVLEAARGMGLATTDAVARRAPVGGTGDDGRTPRGRRLALATVAALVVPQGLGYPIFLALRESFKTEIIVAGGLAVLLALLADALLVVAERA